MMNKVLIKLYIPTLGENYDIYIPVNEMVWKVNRLIVKLISDMSNDNFSIDKDYALINIGKALFLFSKAKELDKKERCIEALRLIESDNELGI